MKWLTKNLRYPKLAQARKTEGKVIANFYVEKDGSITGLKIVQSLSRECDKEVLRILGMMPNWQPGVQNGRPCRTKVSIPIVFKL
jgi:protein TonB